MRPLLALQLFVLIADVKCDCRGTSMLANPPDPRQRGPWPVSSMLLNGTFTKRELKLEVFFPATPGSESGAKPYTQDIRSLLTDKINKKIPDSAIPYQPYNNTFFDLPFDTAHGQYPLIVFIHGTAGWRSQSLNLQSHWASRGFVVAAIDYPGINLKDMLRTAQLVPGVPKTDQVGDTRLIMAELQSLQDPRLHFLQNRVNLSKVALIGHSAGALALEHLSDLGQVMVPMAGDGSKPQVSTLLIGAQNDSEVPPRSHQIPAFATTPVAKRLIVGSNMGHQAFSDLCWIGESEGGICGIGKKYHVLDARLFEPLAVNGCSFHNHLFFEPEKNWALIKYATSGVLEETLHCAPAMAARLRTIGTEFDYVAEYKEQLA